MLCGEKFTPTPAGVPPDASEIVDVKLPIGVAVKVVVAELPCGMLIELGTTVMPKSGDGPEEVTTRLREQSCERPPALDSPLNVM